MFLSDTLCHCTQDGNGQFAFPKLVERGSTTSITSDSSGVSDTLSEHVDDALKGTSIHYL